MMENLSDPTRCRVCNGTGWVISADPGDGTPYESACPEPVHNLDTGHTRDPKGEEWAATGREWPPLDDLDW